MATRKYSKGKDLLAIDFGSYSIKMVSGRINKEGLFIHKMVTIPLTPEIYSNGEISNARELGVLIKNAIEDNGFKRLPIVCTISGPNCVLRTIVLPQVKDADLDEMVSYEIRQYLPVDVNQYVIQYSLLPMKETIESMESNSINLLVGAVPRSFAESLHQIFREIDLFPYALDLQVHSMGKLFEYIQSDSHYQDIKELNVMLIDVGHTQLDISVYDKGQFFMNRRFSNGGYHVDQKICRVFDVSMQDAELERHQVPDISINSDQYSSEHRVINVIQSSVDEWVNEISRIVKFYVSRNMENTIGKIYLFGGSSQIKGLDLYIERELGIKTICLKECHGIQFENPDIGEHVTYLNAFGALIRREEQ